MSSHYHSNEDDLFEKIMGSPLSCHQNKSHRSINLKKCLGKVGWALFEEEGSPVELDEENYNAKKKEVELERNNVVTSEFLLEEEKQQGEDENLMQNMSNIESKQMSI